MQKIIIIRPTQHECIERIDSLSAQYRAPDWMTLYHDASAMNEEDRDEFRFLCDTYWSDLIDRDYIEGDAPPDRESEDYCATREPGFIPGFAFLGR